MAAYQQMTQDWWFDKRHNFNLYVSQLVLQEAAGGDKGAAEKRLEALQGMPVLPIDNEPSALAEKVVQHGLLPQKAFVDATHIAIATTSKMDYLLTWNLKHIANATIRRDVESLCRAEGYNPVTI